MNSHQQTNHTNGHTNGYLNIDEVASIKSDKNIWNFETRAIHTGQDPYQWKYHSLIPPIFHTTTYQLDVDALFDENSNKNEYDYSRSGNPSRTVLEEAIATLEDAKYGLCFSSGMGSIITIGHLLHANDHIICFDDIYGGTHRYFRNCIVNYNIETSFVDCTDGELIEKSIKPNTKLFWIETPSNPLMKIVDLESICNLRDRKAPEALIVVDNTFMSPVFQNPLKFGVDLVVHSLTKYVNGHGDVVMGGVMTNRKDLYTRLKFLQNALGAVPSPIDCFLLNRGLKTLKVRMIQHEENGLAIAKFLEAHPMVRKVIYIGLPSHPQYDLVLKQCKGSNGMLSFYIKGTAQHSKAFLKSLNLFRVSVSLGSVESRVELPAKMSHASVPKEHLQQIGVDDTLIRLSIGIENVDDLIADLKSGLEAASKIKCSN